MRQHTKKILSIVKTYSLPLFLGILMALIWANTAPESYRHFVELEVFHGITIHFIVKEIFMPLFFGIAMAEIVVAIRPGGAMYPLQKAINPLMATAGGVIGPIVIYFILAVLCNGLAYRHGWGIVTATDIAIAWLGAKLIFGEDHPAVKYLLLLAVADDAIGLVIIGVFYPSAPVELPYLTLCLLGMVIAYLLRRFHILNHLAYLLLAGIPCWFGLHLANIEPALALVFVVPFMPSHHQKKAWEKENKCPANAEIFTLESFYQNWKPVVDYGLFFFGLVSAGVHFSQINIVTILIILSLLLGKALGITTCGILGVKLGFALPQGMTKKDLCLVGIVAGAGLTVALFICDAAFESLFIINAAKMGALFSLAAIPLGYAASRILRRKENRKMASLKEKETIRKIPAKEIYEN